MADFGIIEIMASTKKNAPTKSRNQAQKKIGATEKKPTGRPTDYRPEYDKRIVEVMREGASLVEFVAEIGVTRETAYEWARVHPSFSDAFTRARLLCQAWWERQGRDNLLDEFSDGAGTKFNDRLWNKNVSCRFREDWSDAKPEEKNPDNTLVIRFE
jgi:transposase